MVSGKSSNTHSAESLKAMDGPFDDAPIAGPKATPIDLDQFDRPAERAYHGIRDAILNGTLKGGDHLREESLAQMTGTSRTPVRDALGRLVAEGLARAENRSRFVSDFSYDEVVVIFDLRSRLEGYAARLASQRIRPEEIDDLTRIVDEIDELADEQTDESIQTFAALNTQFHSRIISATRSTQLQTLSAQTISLPLEMIKKFVWEQKVNIRRSNGQHRDIVGALISRNPEWAETAMSAHILSTRPYRKPDGA